MALVWSPAGGGRWVDDGKGVANAQAPKAATAIPKPLEWTPAGGGQFVGGTASNVPGGTSQPGAPAPAVYTPPTPDDTPRPKPEVTETPAPTPYDRGPARGMLANLLRQYGLEDMLGDIDSFIIDNGSNDAYSLAERVRGSSGYKTRFAGLINLRNKGIADISNEGEYLDMEKQYRQVFREAGIQSFLGVAGSRAERDAIAKLVGDYVISVDEVKSRISDAQRVVADTAPEVRDALTRYYNLSAADLVAYTLDPSRTKDRINDIANAAVIGGYAQRSGLMADIDTAQGIAAQSQGNDVSIANTWAQMSNAAEVKSSTKRLADIESTDLTDSEIVRSEYQIDRNAQKKIKTLQSRERARFGGSTAIGQDTLMRGTGV